ncbi:hypothetical protein TNIN_65271, partial [Trichonephila inaurata madagascariensis]
FSVPTSGIQKLFFYQGFDRLSNTFCGSTAYAAPEVLQGVPYDPFMYDIWSLGCVLYVMVTGNMPFDESNVMKMVEDQLNKAISYPTSFQLSESLITLIDRMLEPDILSRLTIIEVQKSTLDSGEAIVLAFRKCKKLEITQDPNIISSSSSDSLGTFLVLNNQ